MTWLRPAIIFAGLILLWQGVVSVFGLPHFILPGPGLVFVAWGEHFTEIMYQAQFTLIEILGGLAAGVALGCSTSLTMAYFAPARRWILPVLVISQAIPVFALAPILVLWFGYGLASRKSVV